ncbi:hypothetical protein O181_049065 [Austropuccinia psidii MF-1]|uniref:Uncharacterized protein n=1 Tax=Austropuccinia psidii MF-1 TaxID=1389203 RepID=A0A9Q3HPQ5_9BASI|nr:hypothetical protein [Austropuccinia psidii MF-1]
MTTAQSHLNHAQDHHPAIYDPSSDIIPVEQNDIIRLQIFIPLATLTAIFSNLVSALLIKPSMSDINDLYYTLLTPNSTMIGCYWIVIFACQVAMSFMVVFTSRQRYRTENTKQTFVHAVGMPYVLGLFIFALWPMFWAAELFLGSTILLVVLLFITTYTLHSIWRHSPPSFISRPFSYIFIYLPVHLFQAVVFTVDLPQSLLITLKWYRSPIDHSWEPNHTTHTWIIFAIVLLLGLTNAYVIYRAKDFVRTVAVVYLTTSVLVKGSNSLGKVSEAPHVYSALVAVAATCMVSFIASFVDLGPDRGRIVLLDEQERRQHVAPT